MEPSIEDIIRGLVAESNGELSCAIAEVSKRLGYLESKLKTYEDAAPVNYNGPQFNRTTNTRGRPKIEFVEANGNKAYVFECNFPDAHEPSIKIGVKGAALVKTLYHNSDYRLRGRTVGGKCTYHVERPHTGGWYEPAGSHPVFSDDEVHRLQSASILEYDRNTSGYRLTQKGKGLYVSSWKGSE